MLLDEKELSTEELMAESMEAVEAEIAAEGETDEKQTEEQTGAKEQVEQEQENVKGSEEVEGEKEQKAEGEEGESKKEELTKEQLDKKAFATITKKLKESKAQETRANQELLDLKEKIAKVQGITVEELEKQLTNPESKDTGLTDEARAEIEKAKAAEQVATQKLNEITLGQGIQELVELGGEENDIVSFIKTSKETWGIDFTTNPNTTQMKKLFQAQFAEKFINAKVQAGLKAKKDTVTVNTPGSGSTPKPKAKDTFLEKMMEYAKNN